MAVRGGGSAGRAAAGAIRLGNTVGAAITDRRVLAPVEGRILAGVGSALVAIAVASVLWPRLVALPLAVVALWLGGTLLAKAYALHRQRRATANILGDLLGSGNTWEVRDTFYRHLSAGRSSHDFKAGLSAQRVKERSRIDTYAYGLFLYVTDTRALPLAPAAPLSPGAAGPWGRRSATARSWSPKGTSLASLPPCA